MGKKSFQADQLIPTSSTPPPEAGFYRIDRQTIGVVGNMSFRDPNTQAMIPVGKGAIPFSNFAPRLLASLVASSVAECTSGVVTVTATAHGIVATAFDGFEFYYPGSPSLAAGWYSNFSRTSADVLTFSAPGTANFVSESVNAGAAMTSEITIVSLDLPANALSVGDIVRIIYACNQDATANSRKQKIKLGTTNLGQIDVTSATSSFIGSLAFSVAGQSKQWGVASREHTTISSEYYGTDNISTSLTVSLTNQLGVAGSYSGISSAKLEIQ